MLPFSPKKKGEPELNQILPFKKEVTRGEFLSPSSGESEIV
jgi:hypothetical protein